MYNRYVATYKYSNIQNIAICNSPEYEQYITPSNKFTKLIHDHLAQAVAHTRAINNPFAYTENYSTTVRVLDVLHA